MDSRPSTEEIASTFSEAMRRLRITEADLRELFNLGQFLNMTHGGTAIRDFLATYQRGMFQRAFGLQETFIR